MAATAYTLRLQQQLREDLRLINDAQVRDLVAAWADAWDEIAPDLNAALVEQLVVGKRISRAQLLRSLRLRAALEVVRERLEALAADAGVRIIADLQDVIDAAGGAQASVIDSQLPPNSRLVALDSWARVDPAQIDAIVQRTTGQITVLTRPLGREAYQVLRRELIRGVAAGTNPRATARRILARAEGRFNGGLTRALNIARTETLDAYRAAAQLGQAQHTDVLTGWQWLATLDARTCPSCWAQHGTIHDQADPGPLDHQQGRCARMPVVKPWADLGFGDLDEPPSLVPDAAARFAALDPTEQAAVLGPGRYRAWVAGDYPMDTWSRRHTTDGWRDSYRVSPAPQSGGRSSRTAA